MDVMVTGAPLKPWHKLPYVKCSRCDAQATMRAEPGGILMMHEGRVIDPDPIPAEAWLEAELTCRTHADVVAGELCDRYGEGAAGVLRISWLMWFRNNPINRLIIHYRGWRLERRQDRCDHVYSGDGNRSEPCTHGCGTWRIGHLSPG